MEKSPDRIERLKAACAEAIDLFKPGTDGVTRCNFGCHFIASRLGFSGFHEMVANQIVDRMNGAPDFAEVSPEAAQNLANDGRLVIAGIKDEPHGHVAVCHPGTTCYSGKWRDIAPMVAQIGNHNKIESANYAFAEKPKYYAWITDDKS